MFYPYGNNLKLYIEGTSRGEKMTAVLKFIPAGIKIDAEALAAFMARRAPGRDAVTTARREADTVHILTGIRDGITDGTPVTIEIYNTDAAGSDPDYASVPRPSHADYPASVKYGPSVDLRGGGHFSGRLTAPFCAAGFICLSYLKQSNINIRSHIYSVGNINDTPFDPVNPDICEISEYGTLSRNAGKRIRSLVESVRDGGDSIGGVIECSATGLAAGIGEHMFAGLEARISSAVFAIPAVKGVEFGSGFYGSSLRGSENNDPYITADGVTVQTETNNAGGILGGMSTGMPLIFRAAFKPTPSIAKEQKTVRITGSSAENITMTLNGRNDPCIVLRAAPAVEAACAVALCDALLDPSAAADATDSLRRDIDIADRQIVCAFCERMTAAEKIGRLKAENGSGVYVPEREKALLDKIEKRCEPAFSDSCLHLYAAILKESRGLQTALCAANGLRAFSGYSGKSFYLLGEKLSHSLSPELHSIIADYSYGLRPLSAGEAADFIVNGEYDALNITVPYKRLAARYVGCLSPEAAKIRAINTVIRKSDGTTVGCNTDIAGFGYMLDALGTGDCTLFEYIIAGNGGAAEAVKYCLETRGCSYSVFTRKDPQTHRFEELEAYCAGRKYILVNATPVGMFPDNGGCIFPADVIKNACGYIDLVYNPYRTYGAIKAEEYGIPHICGMKMLAAQAIEAASLLTGIKTEGSLPGRVAGELEQKLANIWLIGMPGCGKTVTGRLLADITGRRFFDTDDETVLRTGMSCRDYLLRYGEETFRREEHISVLTASHLHGAVIACGGGAVTNPDNYLPLKQTGIVVCINRDLSQLDISDRPLSGGNIGELYRKRAPMYEKFRDFTVENTSPEDAVLQILERLKKI